MLEINRPYAKVVEPGNYCLTDKPRLEFYAVAKVESHLRSLFE